MKFLSIRSIAIFVLATFAVTNISPVGYASVSAPELPVSPFKTLEIPAEFGQVTGKIVGDASSPVFIHIQSAHGNYEAEKNIEKLLGYIQKNSSVKLMLLEGAAHKLQPDLFHIFKKHPDFNRKVMDKFIGEGYLTGPENFLIDSGRGSWNGFGVEDLEAYKKDREAFIQVVKSEKTAEKYLGTLRAAIDKRFASKLNKELLTLVRQEEALGSGSVSFEAWIKILGEASKKHLLKDLSDSFYQEQYPFLIRYYRLQSIGSKIEPAKARAEAAAFLKELEKHNLSKDIVSSFKTILNTPEASLLKAGNGYSMLRLAFDRAFTKLPRDFSMKSWPAWTLYAQYVILMQELESKGLQDEVAGLKDAVFAALAKTPEEKEYLAASRHLYLLKRLFSLELTRNEYEELRATSPGPRSMTPTAQTLFATAMSFYATAIARENRMFTNALQRMGAEKQDRAVIVTGGFHADGLRKLAASKGCSYLQIMPRISEVSKRDREVYLRSILGSRDLETSQMGRALVEVPEDMDRVERDHARAELRTMTRNMILSDAVPGDSRALSAELDGSSLVARNIRSEFRRGETTPQTGVAAVAGTTKVQLSPSWEQTVHDLKQAAADLERSDFSHIAAILEREGDPFDYDSFHAMFPGDPHTGAYAVFQSWLSEHAQQASPAKTSLAGGPQNDKTPRAEARAFKDVRVLSALIGVLAAEMKFILDMLFSSFTGLSFNHNMIVSLVGAIALGGGLGFVTWWNLKRSEALITQSLARFKLALEQLRLPMTGDQFIARVGAGEIAPGERFDFKLTPDAARGLPEIIFDRSVHQFVLENATFMGLEGDQLSYWPDHVEAIDGTPFKLSLTSDILWVAPRAEMREGRQAKIAQVRQDIETAEASLAGKYEELSNLLPVFQGSRDDVEREIAGLELKLSNLGVKLRRLGGAALKPVNVPDADIAQARAVVEKAKRQKSDAAELMGVGAAGFVSMGGDSDFFAGVVSRSKTEFATKDANFKTAQQRLLTLRAQRRLYQRTHRGSVSATQRAEMRESIRVSQGVDADTLRIGANYQKFDHADTHVNHGSFSVPSETLDLYHTPIVIVRASGGKISGLYVVAMTKNEGGWLTSIAEYGWDDHHLWPSGVAAEKRELEPGKHDIMNSLFDVAVERHIANAPEAITRITVQPKFPTPTATTVKDDLYVGLFPKLPGDMYFDGSVFFRDALMQWAKENVLNRAEMRTVTEYSPIRKRLNAIYKGIVADARKRGLSVEMLSDDAETKEVRIALSSRYTFTMKLNAWESGDGSDKYLDLDFTIDEVLAAGKKRSKIVKFGNLRGTGVELLINGEPSGSYDVSSQSELLNAGFDAQGVLHLEVSQNDFTAPDSDMLEYLNSQGSKRFKNMADFLAPVVVLTKREMKEKELVLVLSATPEVPLEAMPAQLLLQNGKKADKAFAVRVGGIIHRLHQAALQKEISTGSEIFSALQPAGTLREPVENGWLREGLHQLGLVDESGVMPADIQDVVDSMVSKPGSEMEIWIDSTPFSGRNRVLEEAVEKASESATIPAILSGKSAKRGHVRAENRTETEAFLAGDLKAEDIQTFERPTMAQGLDPRADVKAVYSAGDKYIAALYQIPGSPSDGKIPSWKLVIYDRVTGKMAAWQEKVVTFIGAPVVKYDTDSKLLVAKKGKAPENDSRLYVADLNHGKKIIEGDRMDVLREDAAFFVAQTGLYNPNVFHAFNVKTGDLATAEFTDGNTYYGHMLEDTTFFHVSYNGVNPHHAVFNATVFDVTDSEQPRNILRPVLTWDGNGAWAYENGKVWLSLKDADGPYREGHDLLTGKVSYDPPRAEMRLAPIEGPVATLSLSEIMDQYKISVMGMVKTAREVAGDTVARVVLAAAKAKHYAQSLLSLVMPGRLAGTLSEGAAAEVRTKAQMLLGIRQETLTASDVFVLGNDLLLQDHRAAAGIRQAYSQTTITAIVRTPAERALLVKLNLLLAKEGLLPVIPVDAQNPAELQALLDRVHHEHGSVRPTALLYGSETIPELLRHQIPNQITVTQRMLAGFLSVMGSLMQKLESDLASVFATAKSA